MKVHHVTKAVEGGAGIAARRLSSALGKVGQLSKIYTFEVLHNCDHKLKNKIALLFWEKLESLYYKRSPLEKFEILFSEKYYRPALYDRLIDCDIVNLHWISHFIDWKRFFCQKSLPKIVWTLHDMNPFLGLAHYEGDARKLRELAVGIGDSSKDEDSLVLSRKKEILGSFDSSQIAFVCPSIWFAEKAKESFLSGFSIEVIPNGIDTSIFKPICRKNFTVNM